MGLLINAIIIFLLIGGAPNVFAEIFGSNLNNLVTINDSDGSVTTIGSFGYDFVINIALDTKTNTLYGFDDKVDVFLKIDKQTGKATAVGTLPMQLPYNMLLGLTYDASQNVFLGTVSSQGPGNFYGFENALIKIDPITASMNIIGRLPAGRIDGLAFDKAGTLWGIQGGRGRLYTISPTTATTNFVREFMGAYFLTDLAGILPNGNFLGLDTGIAYNYKLGELDITPNQFGLGEFHAITKISDPKVLNIAATTVPLPSTVILFLSGGVTLLGLRRCKS